MSTILSIFSNDPHNPLINLRDEDDAIYEIFNRELSGQFNIIRYSNTSVKSLNNALSTYGSDLTLFHFGGHADDNHIHIADINAKIDAVAQQLKQRTNAGKLKLVVINGCSTVGHVRAMLNIGACVVIASYAEVDDKRALEFSKIFYKELCENCCSIEEAFEIALWAAQTATSNNININNIQRGAGFPDPELKNDTFLWGLFTSDEKYIKSNPFYPYDLNYVEGGVFKMGNAENSDEYFLHHVAISDFYIGQYLVSNNLFHQFLQATSNPLAEENIPSKDALPATNVSWWGAIKFCNWLSGRYGYKRVYSIDKNSVSTDWKSDGFRLPTEAEWEYAAKDGSRHKKYSFSGSNKINEVAWYQENSTDGPYAVGQLSPNELGLYDMSGNVWEWCWDFYSKDYYGNSPEENPTGPSDGARRVARGGSWRSNKYNCKVVLRQSYLPETTNNDIGFRCVRKM